MARWSPSPFSEGDELVIDARRYRLVGASRDRTLYLTCLTPPWEGHAFTVDFATAIQARVLHPIADGGRGRAHHVRAPLEPKQSGIDPRALREDILDGVRKAVAMAKDGAPDNEIEAAVAYVGNALGALVATIPTA